MYVGSVSKSLSPAVRLGWMVPPDHLVDGVLAAKGEREGWTSVVDQLTLADLIDSGAYDRHVRQMRQRYRRRRDQLVALLAERAPHIRPTGVAAGLHAVLRHRDGWARGVRSRCSSDASTTSHPADAGPPLAVSDRVTVRAYRNSKHPLLGTAISEPQ